MLTLPSGTGKYTTHGPHYTALRSHYAALGPRPNGLRPSGGIMGPSGSIMFGPRAVYFPVSLGQGQHIIPLLWADRYCLVKGGQHIFYGIRAA